ncbi:hypothetical protein HanXRQr2_Chr09g0390391 [Helianthus annuus]|uniref:Uncharacterized protein n=1 Tax=Helianthus annuus TaxID=4232 RepID=A0A9K3N8P6_HELAN|nr:hypothetical protein HanXRQr2_Chr09g0390391 [Helianthus annuus]
MDVDSTTTEGASGTSDERGKTKVDEADPAIRMITNRCISWFSGGQMMRQG